MTFEFGARRRRHRRSKSRSKSRKPRRGNPEAKKAMKIAVRLAKSRGGLPRNYLAEAWREVKGNKSRSRRSRSRSMFGAQVIPGF